MNGPQKAPVQDLLYQIPKTRRISWQKFHEDGSSAGYHLCPIGKLSHEAADEITTLRQKLEQAEARCAELEGQPTAVQLSELMRGLDIGPGFASMPPYIFYITGKKIADQAKEATDSAILHKQAEAVEKLAAELKGTDRYQTSEFRRGMVTSYGYATDYAQRLRQQATEIERGNP